MVHWEQCSENQGSRGSSVVTENHGSSGQQCRENSGSSGEQCSENQGSSGSSVVRENHGSTGQQCSE